MRVILLAYISLTKDAILIISFDFPVILLRNYYLNDPENSMDIFIVLLLTYYT